MAESRKQDLRSDEVLFAASLEGDEDDERASAAVVELQRRGTRAVFELALRYLRAPSPIERVRGADVLGQLGFAEPVIAELQRPLHFLHSESVEALVAALPGETSPTVLQSIGVALGHRQDVRAVGALIPFKKHPDGVVRFGVVLGLTGHYDDRAVDALADLCGDADDDVRNWATFALGTQLEGADSAVIREALVRRLSDDNTEVRGEALVGLAVRKDPRVVEPLKRELGGKDVIVLAVEAAESLGDPTLLPLLIRLRDSRGKSGSYYDDVLIQAIASLENAR